MNALYFCTSGDWWKAVLFVAFECPTSNLFILSKMGFLSQLKICESVVTMISECGQDEEGERYGIGLADRDGVYVKWLDTLDLYNSICNPQPPILRPLLKHHYMEHYHGNPILHSLNRNHEPFSPFTLPSSSSRFFRRIEGTQDTAPSV